MRALEIFGGSIDRRTQSPFLYGLDKKIENAACEPLARRAIHLRDGDYQRIARSHVEPLWTDEKPIAIGYPEVSVFTTRPHSIADRKKDQRKLAELTNDFDDRRRISVTDGEAPGIRHANAVRMQKHTDSIEATLIRISA